MKCESYQGILSALKLSNSPTIYTKTVPGVEIAKVKNLNRVGGYKVMQLWTVLTWVIEQLEEKDATHELKNIINQGTFKNAVFDSFELLLRKYNCLVQIFEITVPNQEDQVICRQTGQYRHTERNCACLKGLFSTDWSEDPAKYGKVFSFVSHKKEVKFISNLSTVHQRINTDPRLMNSRQLCQSLEKIKAIYPSEYQEEPSNSSTLLPKTSLHYFTSKFPAKMKQINSSTYKFVEVASGYKEIGKYFLYKYENII